MTTKPNAWQEGKCNAPMWMGGAPAGVCGAIAHGHQLPEEYLQATRGPRTRYFVFLHACPVHGGPREEEVRIFQDGYTAEGRQMWCAVAPDFVNLQESPAGFDGNPVRAARKLAAAIAARGAQ